MYIGMQGATTYVQHGHEVRPLYIPHKDRHNNPLIIGGLFVSYIIRIICYGIYNICSMQGYTIGLCQEVPDGYPGILPLPYPYHVP